MCQMQILDDDNIATDSKWTVIKHQLKSLQCTASQNNDTDADCNFDADQPILVIVGKDIAETVCYQMVICCPASPN